MSDRLGAVVTFGDCFDVSAPFSVELGELPADYSPACRCGPPARGGGAVCFRVMAMNSGKDIDPIAKRVRDRDGKWHDVDELQIERRVLYYGRPLDPWPMQFDYREMWAFADLDVTVSRVRFFLNAPDAIDWYVETDPIDIVDVSAYSRHHD